MSVKTQTKFGSISISNDAIASVVNDAVSQCYGVVGIARKSSIIAEILNVKELTKGIYIEQDKKGVSVDVYLVIAFDVKITEVLLEVQKRVKYDLERTFEIKVKKVNVFAQTLKRVE